MLILIYSDSSFLSSSKYYFCISSICSVNLLNLSLISFYARGMRNTNKKHYFYTLNIYIYAFSRRFYPKQLPVTSKATKQYRADFCYIQKYHSLDDDAKSQFCPNSEHSAGVKTLKNWFNGEVVHSFCDSDGHFVCLLLICNDTFIITANVYGYNDDLLEVIENKCIEWLGKYPKAYIIMGGDFSIIQDYDIDKWPPGRPNSTNTSLKKPYD